ncbi:hypothetical protein B0H34DRAFT_702365 [Crassisporium funariophilum]|nr:hypothetical protein B0H34DRAFT_702365 [Crassisporium funariophilum]
MKSRPSFLVLLPVILIAATVVHAFTRCPASHTGSSTCTILAETILPTKPDQCSSPPRGQCQFYADCIETRYTCGPAGYPLGYGLHFCAKFKDAYPKFSLPGQKWMLDTMQCLQSTLIPEATSAPSSVATCEELSAKAFDSHAECYLSSGLCSLPVSDWMRIVDVVKFGTMISSWDAVKQTVEAAWGCLDIYKGMLAERLPM